MKKLITFLAIFAAACSTPKAQKIIVSTEKLPTGELIYTVNDTVPYTFIAPEGAYTIGQIIK